MQNNTTEIEELQSTTSKIREEWLEKYGGEK